MQGLMFLLGTVAITLALSTVRKGNTLTSSVPKWLIAICLTCVGTGLISYSFGILAGVILAIALIGTMGIVLGLMQKSAH